MEEHQWRVVVLDGDELRERLWPDLKYDPDGRVKSMRRAIALAENVARAGAVVILAMVAPYEKERRDAQDRAACAGIPFHVVRVKASRELRLERRPDEKVHQVAYEEPVSPALTIDTGRGDVSDAACSVLKLLEDVS
jgi:adenylylsulfate kinase-like enzyme